MADYTVRLIPEYALDSEGLTTTEMNAASRVVEKVGFVGFYGGFVNFHDSKGDVSVLLASYPAHRVLSVESK